MAATGALSQGYSKAAAAESQSNAFAYQAQQDRNRAQVAYQQGNQNEEAQRRQADQQLGRIRANAAQSGVGTDGSAADVLQQSTTNSTLDALNIRYQADLQARGALAQADLDTFSARTKNQEATNARIGAWLNAGSAALSGGRGYLSGGGA